jgi:ferrous-iron efflux pump FieF
MKHAHSEKALLASSITVGTVLLLVFAKAVAFIFSNSAAVLSSLVDSISDIGMSAMTFISIRWSLKPADDDHRHGHGKVEGVIAMFQAAVLIGASSFLTMTAVSRFFRPEPVSDHLFTIFLMACSAGASLFLTYMQRRAARLSGSLALEADTAHYATDVWMNGAVVLVVLLDYAGLAPTWFDPLASLFVAGIFAWTAYGIARKSFDMLMDRELPQEFKDEILKEIHSHSEVKGVHDLRCIKSGMRIFISFDMELDSNLLLWSAHEIAREIEMAILNKNPTAEILIHLDPEGDIADTRHGEHI